MFDLVAQSQKILGGIEKERKISARRLDIQAKPLECKANVKNYGWKIRITLHTCCGEKMQHWSNSGVIRAVATCLLLWRSCHRMK
jgi:hypothetical protein